MGRACIVGYWRNPTWIPQRAGLKDVSTKVKTNVIPATHLWGMFLMMKMRKKKIIEHPSPTPLLLLCNGWRRTMRLQRGSASLAVPSICITWISARRMIPNLSMLPALERYHYYGIAVKESSQYYDVMYSKKGAAWVSETGKKEVSKQTVAYSPRSKLGTLLPEFPNVKDLNLPASLPEEKVSTFIMMYRTHCQRILDTVIRANFDEVQSFLLHFWQGMPPHMLPVLGSSTVVNIVGVCDSILYKAISGVLMPTVLQALPDSLTQVIRKFAKQLDEWLKVALHDLPENLRNIKFELSRRFSQILRRQTSLNHLCQASRTVIHSADITFQMLEDWRNVDLNSITKQTLYTMEDSRDEHRKLIIQLYQEFDHLLEEQSPIESYIEWLDTMVDHCVVKVAAKRQGSLKKVAQQFLLMWSCFGTRVIRDMTLHSAPSFGSFHLIHLMFDDYVLYLLESLHCQERANELMRAMKGEGSTAEVREEIILTEAAEATAPTPSPVPSFSPAKSAPSVEVPPPSSPGSNPSPEYTGLSTTGAMQSYTWSLTYTVTTAAGSPAENSQQLPCMRNTHVPSSSVTHRIPVYPHREEHGYTGSYNYGSYGNQHPHPMQSQYPALPHDTAISGPLHYAPYHRSSAQVSQWSWFLAQTLVYLVPNLVNTVCKLLCMLCVQHVCPQGEDSLFISVISGLQWLAHSGCSASVHAPFALTCLVAKQFVFHSILSLTSSCQDLIGRMSAALFRAATLTLGLGSPFPSPLSWCRPSWSLVRTGLSTSF
uniref:Regulatory factor X4 n=1 Tax=Macaca mulatta TaxID=9544 RepID=A0A5F8A3S4_MACMU